MTKILGEPAAVDEARLALGRMRHRPPDVEVQPGDEVRRFRTPPWTWAIMGGIEGLAVIRSGDVVFLIVTRMN